MADYYVNGYTPPKGVNSRDKVRQIQATLGVKQDGIWGPNTQAAWVTQGFGNIWKPDVPTSPAPSTQNRVDEGPAQTLNSASKQLTRSNQTDTGIKQTQAQSTQNALQRNPLLSSNFERATRLPNVSGAAQGLSSSLGTNPSSQPVTASTPAIWSGRLQEDWNAFLASQAQRGDGIDAVPTTPRNRAAEEMLAKLSTGMEKAASIQPTSPQSKPHALAAPSQYEIDRASHMLGWGVSNLIHDARLTKYEKAQAIRFVGELSSQQLNLLSDWINEKGVEEFLHGYNIRSTAEKLVKETTIDDATELSITPELVQPSYFRPRIIDLDTWENEFPDVKFSNFYYLNGEYHVDVSYVGTRYWGAPTLTTSISVGKDLPRDSIIRVSRPHIPMLISEQMRLYMEILLTPANYLDLKLNEAYGDNLFTSMPGISDALDAVDPWSHVSDIDGESIVIDVLSSYDGNLFKPFNGHEQVIVNRIPQ